MKRRTSLAARGGERSPQDDGVALWPFGVLIALAAAPIVWLLLAAIFWMTNRWLGWPTTGSAGGLLYLAVAIGVVPIILLILDAIARGGGSVTTPWGGINFRAGAGTEDRPAVEVETGLGFEGQPINDSMVVSVDMILDEARAHDIVRIDLGKGENWWMTRLFALSFGANRFGAPKLFAFVGRDAGVDQAYLGWIHPRDALRLMHTERPQLRFALDRAESIARYMTTVASTVAPVLRLEFQAGTRNSSRSWNRRRRTRTIRPSRGSAKRRRCVSCSTCSGGRKHSPVPGSRSAVSA